MVLDAEDVDRSDRSHSRRQLYRIRGHLLCQVGGFKLTSLNFFYKLYEKGISCIILQEKSWLKMEKIKLINVANRAETKLKFSNSKSKLKLAQKPSKFRLSKSKSKLRLSSGRELRLSLFPFGRKVTTPLLSSD